ncbi:hypothetical protein GCM10023195_55510 [Actinoallomurus liliacearum]|uniref:Uncharacterized protein n=1 Tax=Actinoallomurus liliacearum TaxID=1080073 RepID=A0ABP8TSA5_9ACTN
MAGRAARGVRDRLHALAVLPAADPFTAIMRQVAGYLDQGADAVLARRGPDSERTPWATMNDRGRYLPPP